jgi:predicted deacylase
MNDLVAGSASAAPGTRVRGLFLADPSLRFQQPMQQGDLIARIVDVDGDELAELRAPVDGTIFGLRALPNVQTGDWCCFYAEIQAELAKAE